MGRPTRAVRKKDDVADVLAAARRDKFVPLFLDTLAAYVKGKLFATGNSWITHIGYRLVRGFHLEYLVDAVKDDPFVVYRS